MMNSNTVGREKLAIVFSISTPLGNKCTIWLENLDAIVAIANDNQLAFRGEGNPDRVFKVSILLASVPKGSEEGSTRGEN